MNIFLQTSQKKQIAIVAFVYFITAFALLFFHGVNSGGEAFKYLLDAKSIAGGKSLNYGEFSYFFVTYSLFLSIFIKYKNKLINCCNNTNRTLLPGRI